VLYTDYFSNLRRGYWSVYVGTYTSSELAAARANEFRESGYDDDAYPRCVGTYAQCN
jgi:hypothetical protein